MAALDSTRIESMVLIGSTSYFPAPTRAIQRSVSYETLDEQLMNDMKQRHPRGESQIRSLLTQFRNFADTYEDMNFTPPYLASIKTPTLIIHGDRDPFFPVDIPVTSYKYMPNSYLWVIPNFGHTPIGKNTMWSDAFLSVVKQFLSGEWSE
jgi:pimeloyl-ACP methyl ester carboxylesterase